MVIIKHSNSDSNPYGFGHYFYNMPETDCPECDNGLQELVRDALDRYRVEYAKEMLHEIAHAVFSTENPENTARIYSCAPIMLKLLKRIASKNEICSMRDIYRLIDYINGKDCD